MIVTNENGEIIRREIPKPKADCSKCITKCRFKTWFEHEMWVKEHGCREFKSRSDTE